MSDMASFMRNEQKAVSKVILSHSFEVYLC